MAEEFAPFQHENDRRRLFVPWSVHLAAYEVYCHVCGSQEALVEGWCRGGFGTGELIAFLYARSFPKTEWKSRFYEALKRPLK